MIVYNGQLLALATLNHRFLLRDSHIYIDILKLEVVCFSEMLVSSFKSIRHQNLEDQYRQ